MNIAMRTILITGANRGIGHALVNEALRRGAKRVYAGTRSARQHADPRVTAVTLDVRRAFLPLLQRSKGAIVNNLSLAALAPLPVISSNSVSKEAAFSMTQSLRALLAGQGVTVHAVVLGPIDTDMNRARGIFDGLEKGEEEIFPDPASETMAEGWRTSAAKALERQFAAFVPENAANPERHP